MVNHEPLPGSRASDVGVYLLSADGLGIQLLSQSPRDRAIFGLENGLRHEIANAVGTYRSYGDCQLGLQEQLVCALKKVKRMP